MSENKIYNYYRSDFVPIQTFVDNSITKYIAKINGNINVTDIDNMYKGSETMPFYTPKNDEFWKDFGTFYLFFTMIQFVYPFSQSVSQLIHEKADKIKEGMQMMYVVYVSIY